MWHWFVDDIKCLSPVHKHKNKSMQEQRQRKSGYEHHFIYFELTFTCFVMLEEVVLVYGMHGTKPDDIIMTKSKKICSWTRTSRQKRVFVYLYVESYLKIYFVKHAQIQHKTISYLKGKQPCDIWPFPPTSTVHFLTSPPWRPPSSREIASPLSLALLPTL